MGTARRIAMLVASLTAASSMASGYAHWFFFSGRSAPFTPVPAMFNLASLTNNTVSYFVSDQGPGLLMPGDSTTNIYSQIQAAANVWNQVATSTIRIGFGGFSTVGTPQAISQKAPGIDVVFDDDVVPGLYAFTSLTFQASDILKVANGAAFVPIQRSTITMRKNLTFPYQLASYDDSFFVIAAHEFGHALGLQHTLTSAVMSTAITSSATKSAPLAPDDVAGVSLLYPAANYLQTVGTIRGTVSVNGAGMNMANVVALSANGVAIGTLTNPDGTYQIQGLPPGQYYIYASPLPPAQTGESGPDNIIPPEDALGIPFPANTGFDTEFFGGTRDWTQSPTATVIAGAVVPQVNFNLQARSSMALTYLYAIGYQGQAYVEPPFLGAGTRQDILFSGAGIVTPKGALVPGLGISAVGVGAAASLEPKSLASYYGDALMTVDAAQVQAVTPVAVAVTLPNDMYVLPAAFFVTPYAPPTISGVTGTTDAFGNTTVNLTGSNLSATTSVVFDGAPAPLISANSDGSLTVAAPPASAGYTAYIEALSPDGQTSWQALGSTIPVSYTYSGPKSPAIALNVGLQLPPGTDSMVDIIGINTSCVAGQVSVGLGSSDIVVDRVWVVNTQRVQLNVTVSPNAQAGPVDLTLVCGLQVMELQGVLQVQTANPTQMTMRTPILNLYTLFDGTPAGGTALIPVVGVPLDLTGWQLYVDFQLTPLQMGVGGLITAKIPPNSPPGAASIYLLAPGNSAAIPPVVMQIDSPPPVIVAATDSTGALISGSNAVHVGDTVSLSVTGLTQSPTNAGLSQTQVMVGNPGVPITTPLTIVPGPQTDSYQIQFTLGPNVPTGPQEPVTVGIGTRLSDAAGTSSYLNILPAQQ